MNVKLRWWNTPDFWILPIEPGDCYRDDLKISTEKGPNQ
jgi:hypothetical protein